MVAPKVYEILLEGPRIVYARPEAPAMAMTCDICDPAKSESAEVRRKRTVAFLALRGKGKAEHRLIWLCTACMRREGFLW